MLPASGLKRFTASTTRAARPLLVAFAATAKGFLLIVSDELLESPALARYGTLIADPGRKREPGSPFFQPWWHTPGTYK